jgi:hypothetical protein
MATDLDKLIVERLDVHNYATMEGADEIPPLLPRGCGALWTVRANVRAATPGREGAGPGWDCTVKEHGLPRCRSVLRHGRARRRGSNCRRCTRAKTTGTTSCRLTEADGASSRRRRGKPLDQGAGGARA